LIFVLLAVAVLVISRASVAGRAGPGIPRPVGVQRSTPGAPQ
jgi:hypothetical protein